MKDPVGIGRSQGSIKKSSNPSLYEGEPRDTGGLGCEPSKG